MVLARRLVDDRAEAEDVLQSALTSAFMQRHRYEPQSNIRAWVCRYLVHEASNVNRQRRRRQQLSAEGEHEVISAETLQEELHWEEWIRQPHDPRDRQ